MNRHVALIRGINVGKAKRVAMADLRSLMEELGYGDVRTLLNSGNVVFTDPRKKGTDAGPRIEAAMTDRLGVSAKVIVLSAQELAEAVAGNPFHGVATEPARFLVGVLASPADRARVEALAARQDWSPEALGLGQRVAYLWCPGGILDSPLNTAVSRALGDGVTARNWTTLTKLHALAGA
jgi:uncharacterized protein (DUF1697 family)